MDKSHSQTNLAATKRQRDAQLTADQLARRREKDRERARARRQQRSAEDQERIRLNEKLAARARRKRLSLDEMEKQRLKEKLRVKMKRERLKQNSDHPQVQVEVKDKSRLQKRLQRRDKDVSEERQVTNTDKAEEQEVEPKREPAEHDQHIKKVTASQAIDVVVGLLQENPSGTKYLVEDYFLTEDLLKELKHRMTINKGRISEKNSDSRCFNCPYCKSVFKQRLGRKLLNSHVDQIHGLGYKCLDNCRFSCDICFTMHHSRLEYVHHFKSSHDHDDWSSDDTMFFYQCDYPGCLGQFRDKTQFTYHLGTVHGEVFNCQECDRYYSVSSNYAHHMVKIHQIDGGDVASTTRPLIDCPFCHGIFGWSEFFSHLSQHALTLSLVKAKEEDVQLLCDLCGNVYSTQDLLDKHRTVFHQDLNLKKDSRGRQFKQCKVCLKKLYGATYAKLGAHYLRYHTYEHGTLCYICDARFTSLKSLDTHLKQHAGTPSLTNRRNCFYCTKVFPGYITRNRHHVLAHPEKYLAARPFHCGVCFRAFGTQEEHQVHSEIHAKWECPVCFCYQLTQKAFDDHMMAHAKPGDPVGRRNHTKEAQNAKMEALLMEVGDPVEDFEDTRQETVRRLKCTMNNYFVVPNKKRNSEGFSMLDTLEVEELVEHFEETETVTDVVEVQPTSVKKEIKSRSADDSISIQVRPSQSLYFCQLCSVQLPKAEGVFDHHAQNHQDPEIDNDKEKILERYKNPNTDRSTSTPVFKCNLCEATFDSVSSVVSHSAAHGHVDSPTESYTWECEVCRRKFRHQHHLIRHKKVTCENPEEVKKLEEFERSRGIGLKKPSSGNGNGRTRTRARTKPLARSSKTSRKKELPKKPRRTTAVLQHSKRRSSPRSTKKSTATVSVAVAKDEIDDPEFDYTDFDVESEEDPLAGSAVPPQTLDSILHSSNPTITPYSTYRIFFDEMDEIHVKQEPTDEAILPHLEQEQDQEQGDYQSCEWDDSQELQTTTPLPLPLSKVWTPVQETMKTRVTAELSRGINTRSSRILKQLPFAHVVLEKVPLPGITNHHANTATTVGAANGSMKRKRDTSSRALDSKTRKQARMTTGKKNASRKLPVRPGPSKLVTSRRQSTRSRSLTKVKSEMDAESEDREDGVEDSDYRPDTQDGNIKKNHAECVELVKTAWSSDESVSEGEVVVEQKKKRGKYRGYPDRWTCTICKSSFSCANLLKKHRLEVHLSEKHLTCEVCHLQFLTRTDKMAHRASVHGGLKCPSCNKGFFQKEFLDGHVERVHNGNPKPYKCSESECDFAGRKLSYVKRHELTHSKGQRQGQARGLPPLKRVEGEFFKKARFPCEFCKRNLRSKLRYVCHLRTHLGSEPAVAVGLTGTEVLDMFSCDFPDCSMTFRGIERLVDHLGSHNLDPGPFRCSQCERVYAQEHNLTKHTRISHRQGKDSSDEIEYECRFCTKSGTVKDIIEKHEETHKIDLKSSDGKPILCELCGKEFHGIYYLKRHTDSVHTPRPPKLPKCIVCSETMENTEELEEHMDSHTYEHPLSCHLCGQEFTKRSPLVEHLSAVHLTKPGWRPRARRRYPCPYCGSQVLEHRRYTHQYRGHQQEFERDNPYFCDLCYWPAKSTEVLDLHRQSHEKYKCQVCSKQFLRKGYFETHMRKHDGVKPYQCSLCGKGVGTIETLREHERRHENQYTVYCPVCPENSVGFFRKCHLDQHLQGYHGNNGGERSTAGRRTTKRRRKGRRTAETEGSSLGVDSTDDDGDDDDGCNQRSIGFLLNRQSQLSTTTVSPAASTVAALSFLRHDYPDFGWN